MKLAPNTVSGRVVNTSMAASSAPAAPPCSRAAPGPAAPAPDATSARVGGGEVTGKRSRAPSERPIQFRWAVLVVSDQSIQSRSSRSRPAYSVILKNHWLRNRVPTGVPQRSHAPAITCSLASTVLQEGHQLTGASFFSASPASYSCRKIHCVQR